MYVKIGPYIDWVGPYQIAEKLLFWLDKDDDRVFNFGEWLAGGETRESVLMKLCSWIHDKKKRKVLIDIHDYDVWSMDHTLALIILPMLIKLRERKHGSPYVDLDDVPENLRFDETEKYSPQLTFDFYHDDDVEKMNCDIHTRWEWVLNEIIWAFTQLNDDNWEEQYIKVASEKVKGEIDWEGRELHELRIANGLRLFGKYFQSLWD
jgi:hypothetical protein